MRTPFRQFLRLMNRRSNNGQAIVIVALAFIALIAFVGIATDVAVLLVRYSGLRRAVDAAAVAAAGQVREGTDYLTLQAVAQQFIGIQGTTLDLRSVRVETCETEIKDYADAVHGGTYPTNLTRPYEPPDEDITKIPRSGYMDIVKQDDPTVAKALGIPNGYFASPKGPSELCKNPPQKLVRVSAQIDSETIFLQLLGWRTVMLEASSVSQTAVLDVALLIDTSLSESEDTYQYQKTFAIGIEGNNSETLKYYRTYDINKQGFIDPLIGTIVEMRAYDGSAGNNYEGVDNIARPAVRYGCWAADSSQNATQYSNYAWGGCCNDPGTQGNAPDPVTGLNGNIDPVRTHLGNGVYAVDVNGEVALVNPPPSGYDPDWYVYDAAGLTESQIQVDGQNSYTGKPSALLINGKPDGNYSDLVCRPFKDVRDAARRFIKRLDFVRGDRLFLVTFNADVRTIKPSGSSTPIIVDKGTAIRTLNEKIGVSEGTTPYQGGRCIARQQGIGSPNDPNDPTDYTTAAVNWRNVHSYWTTAQCPDTNMGGGIRAGRAALVDPNWIRRDAVWVMVLLSDGFPNRTPSYQDVGADFTVLGPTRPNVSVTAPSIVPDTNGNVVYGTGLDGNALDISDYCSNPLDVDNRPLSPNVGGFYANGINAPFLGKEPQICVNASPFNWTNGNWGIVGVDSSGNLQARMSFGFCPWSSFCNTTPGAVIGFGAFASDNMEPVISQCTDALTANPNGAGQPYWDTPIWWTNAAPNTFRESQYPYCTSNNPDLRHFCSDACGIINADGTNYPASVNPGKCNPSGQLPISCHPDYDATDYARDQADFSGLLDYTTKTKGSFIAMFSIFFAPRLQDPAKLIGADILGVKFLRYVADAGDNGSIDNRAMKWYRAKNEVRVLNSPAAPSDVPSMTYGGINGDTPFAPKDDSPVWFIAGVIDNNTPSSDPCAIFDYRNYPNSPASTPGNTSAPLTPGDPSTAGYEWLAKQDCGQFFFAENIKKVNDAFTDIAGRLFTRLSR